MPDCFLFLLIGGVIYALVRLHNMKGEQSEIRKELERLKAEVARLALKLSRAEEQGESPPRGVAEPAPQQAAGPQPPADAQAASREAAQPGPETKKVEQLSIQEVLAARLAAKSERRGEEREDDGVLVGGEAESEKEKEKEQESAAAAKVAEEGESAAASAMPPPLPAAQTAQAAWQPQPPEATPAAPKMDFETRVGAVWARNIALVVLAIGMALGVKVVHQHLTPFLKVLIAYAFSFGLVGLGKFFERKLEKWARPVMAGGMAMGFFVAFAAHFVEPMKCIGLGASLAWMSASVGFLLFVTDRWRSEPTAALAIFLGHVCAYVAAGQADQFSLIAIGFLSATAVFMFVRHDWPSLSLFSVVAAYVSHVLWGMANHPPSTPEVSFWVNFSFLSSYYVIFMAADLFWWAKTARKGDAAFDARQHWSARAVGPTNLIAHVALVSFIYVQTRVYVANIEWYFFGLGAAQAALAWAHRRVGNKDWVFYPALAVIFATMGFFAAFDELTLNIVLAAEAIILLLAAHRTRLWVFHGLAQGALTLNFIHYWVLAGGASPYAAQTVGALIGGLLVAGVYYLKSQLEEIWYGDDAALEWRGGADDGPFSRPLAALFNETYGAIAPWLAHAHAIGGSLILTNLCSEYFDLAGAPTTMTFFVLGAAGFALVRRSVPMSLAWATLQGGIVLLTAVATRAAPPALAPWHGLWVAAAGWIACAGASAMAPKRFEAPAKLASALAIGQAAMWLAIVNAIVSFESFGERTLGFYAAGMAALALVYVAHDRVASAARGIDEPRAAKALGGVAGSSAAACLAGAVFIWVFTTKVFGPNFDHMASAALAMLACGAILIALAGARRLGGFYVAGMALLGFCYQTLYLNPLDMMRREGMMRPFARGGIDHPGLTCAIILLTLALAFAKDFILADRERGLKAGDRVASEPLVYAPYFLGLVLLCDFLRHLAGMPAMMAVIPLFALALHFGAAELGLRRGTISGLAMSFVASGLWFWRLARSNGHPLPDAILPVLLMCAEMFALEQAIVMRSTLEGKFEDRQLPLASRWALVVVATFTSLAVGYLSPRLGLGHQWTTAGWAAYGAALIGLGFLFRSRIYRRVALAVFALCLCRVFLVDTRDLEDIYKTMAFITLGLCLLGVAWLYTKYSEEIKKWL